MPADRTLIATGTVGAMVAAICCATPVLAIALGLVGLSAWLAVADFIVIAALMLCLGLIGLGLSLRRKHAAGAQRLPSSPESAKP
jgi:mercuric ion transport protein